MAIVEIKVHPAIGIARVGNSPDEWFVGPETADAPEVPPGGYKDAACRVKRQAARFRLFAYHDDDTPPTELTADDGTITWTVELANNKASAIPRNPGIPLADRDQLNITPGSRTVIGPNASASFDGGTVEVEFAPPHEVPLGELRTDVDGRLLVLGGFGHSSSPSGAALYDYLNNSGWHDDVADGPVGAEIEIAGTVHVAVPSWVIVAPPKFAPTVRPAITLYDRLLQLYRDHGLFGIDVPDPISFRRHVHPILHSAVDHRGVHEGAGSSHGTLDPSLYPLSTAQKTAIVAKLKQLGGTMPLVSNAELTTTQFEVLERWRDDHPTFVDDWAIDPGPLPLEPDELDRGPLWFSIGAAFFPGIEAGEFLLDDANWSAPFRFDHAVVHAGDVTQHMAMPWQADFYLCSGSWWPPQRPDRTVEQSTGLYHDWASGIGSFQDMVDDWHTRGFVTAQGDDLVEVEACATPYIVLVTPILDFVDVQQGPGGATVSRALAVTLEVQSPVACTFQVVAGASTPPFSTITVGTVAVGPTGPSPQSARLWVRYTTELIGSSATDSVTVEHLESGKQWTIVLRGNTVAAVTTAVTLVLDRSGSMGGSGGGATTKIASLQQAATMFVDLAAEDDGIGAVAFDHDVAGELAVTTLGSVLDPFDPGRTAVKEFVGGLTPGGSTSVGDGLERGRELLDAAAGYGRQALVVITDGKENDPLWIADVAASIDATTFGIGIGTGANVDVGALQTLSGNNGGYLLVTGPIVGDTQFVLMKHFLQILAGLTGAEVLLDPEGHIGRGDEIRIPFAVSDAERSVDVIMMSPANPFIDVRIQTPAGVVLHAGDGVVDHVLGDDVQRVRITLPVEVAPDRPVHAGTWHAVLTVVDRPPDGVDRDRWTKLARARSRQRRIIDRAGGRATVPYAVVVHAHSDVALRAAVRQPAAAPGIELEATIDDAGADFAGEAAAWAEIGRPDGRTDRVDLVTVGPGVFRGHADADATGLHRVRVRVAGRTPSGWRFDREQTFTAVIATTAAPPDPRRDHRERQLGELVTCLARIVGDADGLRRRLDGLGIDVDHVLECVSGWARPTTPVELDR